MCAALVFKKDDFDHFDGVTAVVVSVLLGDGYFLGRG
jgi:hypothetical protein